MKAKIREGAFIGQDMGCHKWPHHESYNVDQIFEISDSGTGRLKLVAENFGLLDVPGKYGNGAIYVKKRI